MRRSQGQIFSTDMMVSLAVFLVLVGVSVFLLDQALRNQNRFNEPYTMAKKSEQVSDLLVRTPGYPEGWNSSNVKVVGLAEPTHFIQAAKFEEMKRLDFSAFRDTARIEPFKFFIEARINGSTFSVDGIATGRTAVIAGEESSLLASIDNSGEEWDLYWFGGSLPSYDYEESYTGSRAAMFDTALANRSSYSLLVGDDTWVNSSDIASPDRLDEFVTDGGVYLQEGGGDVISEVAESPDTSPSSSGTVHNPAILREGIEDGDSLEFDDPAYGFTRGTGYVNQSSTCLVCSMRDGSVYYATDDNLTASTVSNLGLNGSHALSSSIAGTNSTYGWNTTADADQVLPTSRQVLFNNSGTVERAKLRVILWK
jgi:hypothetical protein